MKTIQEIKDAVTRISEEPENDELATSYRDLIKRPRFVL